MDYQELWERFIQLAHVTGLEDRQVAANREATLEVKPER